MKKICSLLCMIVALQATAQKKIVVNGHVPALPDDSLIYLISIENKKDSAVIKDGGHFQFNLDVKEGDGYVLFYGQTYQPNCNALFYLEEGTMNITGDGPLLAGIKYAGSPFVDDFNAYQEALGNDPRMAGSNEVFAAYRKATEEQDSAAMKPLLEKVMKINTDYMNIIQEWVNAHPASPISTFLLFQYFQNGNKTVLESQLPRLQPSAKQNALFARLENTIKVAKAITIGKMAPDFSQNDTLGKAIALKDFRGQYVLVDFWASWCGPCRAENPVVLKAYNKFKSKNFTVLGISMDDSREKWMKAVHEDKLPWLQVSELKGFEAVIAKQFDLHAIPTNYLIGPDGMILAQNLRGEDLEKKLSEILK